MRRALRTLLAVTLAAAPAVIAVAPRDAAAQVEDDLREGDRYFEEGNWKKAAAAYDSAIRKYPGQVSPEAYGKRAALFIIQKDFEGGLKFLRDVAKKQHPNAPEVLEQEALILWETGKKGDAITIAERVAAAKATSFLVQNMIGEFYSARDPEKTVAAYEAYLAHRPGELEAKDVLPRARLGFAYLSLARTALATDDVKTAKARYEKAVDQFELLKRKHAKRAYAVTNANNGLCAAYTGLGKYDQAITVCEQIDARAVDPNGSVYFNLGTAYFKKKQFGRARAAATEFTKKKPKEARGYMLIGDAYFEERNFELALENYLRAEQLLRPNQANEKVSLAIQMGLTYKSLPKPDVPKAIEKLEAGIEAKPGDPRIAAALGAAYLSSRDDTKALATTDRLINGKDFAKLPEHRRTDILVVAAKALYNQGKLKDSRARFEAAFALTPKDVTVRRGLVQTIQLQAYQAFKKEDYKAAEALLDQASNVDAGAPGIALDRAVLDIDQGQCERAQKHLEKIKGAKGYDLQYERLMARTYLCIAKPNPKKAAEHYAAADREVKKVQANLIQAEIYTEWAPLLMQSGGDLDDVVSKLQDAVQFSAQAPEIHGAAKRNLAIALFRRGWQSLRSGKSSEAVADFERASREPALLKGTEPLAFEFSHALALLDRGDSAEAAKIFKSLASKGNQNAYLKSPYNKVGSTFFAAYANYRSGNANLREAAAKDFEKLQGEASGAFAGKVRDLLASSWEYVAYDHWRNGKSSAAGKALTSAARIASGDIEKRVKHNRAVLDMGSKQIAVFESLGSSPPEALVNLGILYDQSGKPKEAYEAWTKAAARGVGARDLKKWIDAKQRIYGFN